MRRVSRWRAAVVAALAVVALAACSSGTATAPQVDVTGSVGQAPTITYVAPLSIGQTFRRAVWAGTGPVLVDGGPVLFDYRLEDASTAALVSQTYTTQPRSAALSESSLGVELYRTLRGQRVGARLLQLSPAGSGGASYPTVTVLDVLPLRAAGEAVAARADLPAVTRAADGAPSITPVSAAAPTTLVAQPLIRGTGAQVGAQDVVTFQYAGFVWDTGEEFDSSWSRGTPESHSLLDLSQAFAEGLVEQTVGSQVELVVPPTYPLKVTQSTELAGKTVVFVVDVLATRTPSTEGSS